MKKNIFILTLVFIFGPPPVHSQELPGFPSKPRMAFKKKVMPIGTLKISTGIPSTLIYDGDSVGHMTPYHQVTVYKVPVGPHTLTFHEGSMVMTKTLQVDTGTTGYYHLGLDTAFHDTILRGRPETGHGRLIVSNYLPFMHALSISIQPGLYFNGRGVGYTTGLVAGCYVTQKLRLGAGVSYSSYTTHVKRIAYDWFKPVGTNESEDFMFDYIPVYLDIMAVVSKTRTTAFFSFDIGASFPVTQKVNCRSDNKGSNYYLKIDNFNTGVYLGLALGVKYFFTPFLEGGVSAGFNASFNDMKGSYYMDTAYTQFNNSADGLHSTTGFGVNLMLGFNLDFRQMK